MSQSRPLTEEERADLVAYLDGELAGEARHAIETKVHLDPTWRTEAEALKRTWDLLDYLPRPEPSPSFTQRTLSRLAPVDRAAGPKQSTGRWRLARWLALGGGWAAALLLSAVAGYQLLRPSAPKGPGEADLVRELRIIENRRYYELVDDIDFLHELDHPDLFGEEDSGG
jgi:anti-sigma factor RsiW